MRNSLSYVSYAALAATLALAAPAFAQAPGAAAPPASTPSTYAPTTAAGQDAAANVGAGTTLTTGMSVKDNTGALIGEITALKGDQTTIRMGADTFTVDSAKLAVQGGAATINATQAEIRKMLPKR
jgi:hypothetical protein